jgi:dienelactone hydrolase
LRRGTTRAAWAAQILEAARIDRPPGPGPHPISIQLHGCGGLRPFMRGYSQAAVEAGIAAVTVDSFKPRGLGRLSASALVCTGVMLRGDKRAADVYALYDWARNEPWIDPDRIAFAGWSHGAWTIMDALALGPDAARATGLSDLPPEPLAGLAAAFLVYTYAGYPALTTARGWNGARPAVSALICGNDKVVGHRLPARAFDRLERDGVPVERLVFEDASHAFDDESPNDPRSVHRPDLFDQAKAWYVERLKAAFGMDP